MSEKYLFPFSEKDKKGSDFFQNGFEGNYWKIFQDKLVIRSGTKIVNSDLLKEFYKLDEKLDTEIKELCIPNTVISIEDLNWDSFFVEFGNKVYSSNYGSLLNADKTVLIKARHTNIFNVPETVIKIEENALLGCQIVTIPSNTVVLDGINKYAHTEYYIDDRNPLFKSIDGSIYSKDGTKLIRIYEMLNKNIIIPDGVVELCEGSCSDCIFTKSIILPSSLEIIGKEAFMSSSIEKISIPDSVKDIKESAFRRSELINIIIPSKIKTISNMTFCECDLKKVTIEDGLEYIEEFAFSDSSIEQIVMPQTLKKIGTCAFHDCDVATVIFGGTEEQWKEISVDVGNEDLLDAKIVCLK